MVHWTDEEYKETKLIKQGKKSIAPKFIEIANWINQEFEVKVLNINFQIIPENKLPRLSIIFENAEEEAKFKDDPFEVNKDKQDLVSKKYLKTIQNQKLDFNKEKLFTIFSSFKPNAIEEMNENIPQSEIDNLKSKLAVKELVRIERCFSATVFFLETDEQVKEFESNGQKERFRLEYSKLLKSYDEFDYLEEDKYPIHLESMETINKKYNGEIHWYFR